MTEDLRTQLLTLQLEHHRAKASLQTAEANFAAEVARRRAAEEAVQKTVDEVIAMAYLLIGSDLAQEMSQGGDSLRTRSPVEMIREVKMRAYQRLTTPQVRAPDDAGDLDASLRIAQQTLVEEQERTAVLMAERDSYKDQLAAMTARVATLQERLSVLGPSAPAQQGAPGQAAPASVPEIESEAGEVDHLETTMPVEGVAGEAVDVTPMPAATAVERTVTVRKGASNPATQAAVATRQPRPTTTELPGLDQVIQAGIAYAKQQLAKEDLSASDADGVREIIAALSSDPSQRVAGTSAAVTSTNGNVPLVVGILAQNRECRRRDIDRMMRAQHGLSSKSVTARAFAAAKRTCLMNLFSPRAEISGPATKLLELTPLGRAVAAVLTGTVPPEQSFLARLVARHKSLEHTLLNLETATFLLEQGGQVDLFPTPIALPKGGTLDADILWTIEGQVRYVEAERGVDAREKRERKWASLRQATSDFWVVVPNLNTQRRIASELEMWRLRYRYDVTLHITNLATNAPDRPWLYER